MSPLKERPHSYISVRLFRGFLKKDRLYRSWFQCVGIWVEDVFSLWGASLKLKRAEGCVRIAPPTTDCSPVLGFVHCNDVILR